MLTHETRALLLGGVLLAACSKPDKAPDTAAAPPPEPNVVTFTAANYSYTGPDTIPAGVTTLRLENTGTEPHHLSLVKLNEGKTVEDLMAAMAAPNPVWPAWAVAMGGPNAAEPGKTVAATVSMESGNYVMLCFIPAPGGMPHVAKGMARNLTVVPAATTASPTAAAPEPAADITMTLVDYGFQLSTPITAGRHTIKFENTAGQEHEAVIVKLNPGATIQQWAAAAEKMTGPPPGQLMDGMAGIASGKRGYVTADFAPGEYGVICFAPDARDGKPHFIHGMIQQFTVS